MNMQFDPPGWMPRSGIRPRDETVMYEDACCILLLLTTIIMIIQIWMDVSVLRVNCALMELIWEQALTRRPWKRLSLSFSLAHLNEPWATCQTAVLLWWTLWGYQYPWMTSGDLMENSWKKRKEWSSCRFFEDCSVDFFFLTKYCTNEKYFPNYW